MKIQYLNGSRLYHAFLAGGEAVIRDLAYLNKINVFPVPDADTGTNLATTMRAIAAREKIRGYAVVHVLNPERAEIYTRKLIEILGMAPEFIQDIAPVIGAHAGIGAAAVALVSEVRPRS